MPYDAIIIGSGSGGGVLAERLTTDPGRSVLLVEAGYDMSTHLAGTNPTDPLDRRASRRANGTQNSIDNGFTDWGYTHADGAMVPYGKQLGGSSAHNGQQSFRGTRLDHSVYPAGWRYNDLAALLRQGRADHERRNRIPGSTGMPGSIAFEQAARRAWISRHQRLQQGAEHRSGVGPTTANIKGMTRAPFQVDKYDGRQSVLETFLETARDRPNLEIRAGVRRSRSSSRTSAVATSPRGVVLENPDGTTDIVEAGLIISCANVYGSPTLLMRSGIGPGMAIDLPAVGQNYQNQPLELVTVIYDRNIHPQFGYSVPVTLNKDYDNLAKSRRAAGVQYGRSDLPGGQPNLGSRPQATSSRVGDRRRESASSRSTAPAGVRSRWIHPSRTPPRSRISISDEDRRSDAVRR